MRKIPTVFRRNPDDMRHVLPEVTPGCEWVLAGEGTATRKYDGTCIRVVNDSVYAIWARREVKPGKTPPPGFEPVETDEVTGKTVGWEPHSSSPFSQYIEEARKNWAESHPLPDPWHSDLPPGTYELVGPKVNGNPEHYDRHTLIPHANAEVIDLAEDGDPPWTLAEVEHIVRWAGERGWEGIVWHHPDGRMAKLKARDFR